MWEPIRLAYAGRRPRQSPGPGAANRVRAAKVLRSAPRHGRVAGMEVDQMWLALLPCGTVLDLLALPALQGGHQCEHGIDLIGVLPAGASSTRAARPSSASSGGSR